MQLSNFVDSARRSQDRPALVINDAVCTYANLLDGLQRWSDRIVEIGIEPGVSIGITGESCAEMIMLLLALVQGDQVAVPFLSSNEHETRTVMATADVSGVFHFDASGSAHWTPRSADACHPLLDQLYARHQPGLILFTSGSSGKSKAALHDFSRIWRRCERPDARASTSLVFLTIDHIGGINTLLHVLLAGGTAVFPSDRSVETVCRAIQTHRVQLLPTTPTFLNMFLLSSQRERYDLSSLAMVTYGTEPMPPSTLLGLKHVLPYVRCKQTYGLTETGIVPTRSESDASVWLKLGGPGFETRIVEGILWVRAETSMLGYLNAPSPFDADGWLNTGDLVETRDGHVRILGRASEIINVAGEKVSPGEIEDVILRLDNIEEVVVLHKPSPITGHIVVAIVRLQNFEEPRSLSARVRRHCQETLSPYKVPAIVQVTDAEMMSRRYKKIRRPEIAPGAEMDLSSVV